MLLASSCCGVAGFQREQTPDHALFCAELAVSASNSFVKGRIGTPYWCQVYWWAPSRGKRFTSAAAAATQLDGVSQRCEGRSTGRASRFSTAQKFTHQNACYSAAAARCCCAEGSEWR